MTPTAVILAGGKGTRIAQLHPDVPKPMIPVAGKPFLHWVVSWLAEEGITDIVLSVGHLAGQVEAWANHFNAERPDINLRCIFEPRPLGTGGAIRLCLDECGPWILAVNGDSLLKAGLSRVRDHVQAERLDGALVATFLADTSQSGALDVDESFRLRGFFEKRPGQGLVNAGIYLLKRSLLEGFPRNHPLSMETEIIPRLLADGAALGAVTDTAAFLDIGTPANMARAETFILSQFPVHARATTTIP